jgi:predicted amidophosphoribosyltransferase
VSPYKIKECSECGEEDSRIDHTGVCSECQEHFKNNEEMDDSDFESGLEAVSPGEDSDE